MEDNAIIDLYWARSENAIGETDRKYGGYLKTIAYNILYSFEDSSEAVNDTYLRAWDSMPPERPNILSAFLAKITRHISLNKRRDKRAEKRGGGELDLVLDELAECLPSKSSVEEEIDAKALTETLNKFLGELKETERDMFLRRYWYMDSIKDIAKMFGCGESKVKTTLFRTRQKLLAVLKKEYFADENFTTNIK
ncbi:MAG: sigma-70 family RNA polymerase sigma factor [Oscillospiraceae bacterium]|nr:sigma-70 family RNA polymerase sigma factor [Oscillospiraceae bacterium]